MSDLFPIAVAIAIAFSIIGFYWGRWFEKNYIRRKEK